MSEFLFWTWELRPGKDQSLSLLHQQDLQLVYPIHTGPHQNVKIIEEEGHQSASKVSASTVSVATELESNESVKIGRSVE